MSDRKLMISMGGLLVTMMVAVYFVVRLSGQASSATGDFTNAATAEVKDAQGQVILRGQFEVADEEDDDVERKAALQTTGVDLDASGEAEVETDKTAPATQEIEFSIRNVDGGGTFTFSIDGTDVATATADRNGKAEIELEVAVAARAR